MPGADAPGIRRFSTFTGERGHAVVVWTMAELAMFPLGSVLFPNMPLQLRVFEDRYLVMLAQILQDEPSEFGVVLIERGAEVGGGEHRFPMGTVARITALEGADGFVGLEAEGSRRVEVTDWLVDDPYPRAIVRDIPDLEWDDAFAPSLARTEQAVRRCLAVASEFGDPLWSATTELSDDPAAAAWQLAAIVPIGPLDQQALLRVESIEELLSITALAAAAAEETYRASIDDEGIPDD